MSESDEAHYTVCPGCGERVDPDDPVTMYGYEQVPVPSVGDPNAKADGLGAYFHQGHFLGAPPYRRAPKPPRH